MNVLNRLNVHPELRSRVESMLLVVWDGKGELQEADTAEMQLIEQMSPVGWVERTRNAEGAGVELFLVSQPNLIG